MVSRFLRRAWLSGMRPGRPLRALLDHYSPYVFSGVVPPRPGDPEAAQRAAAELEASLRPLLLPSERAADIAAWSDSPHFVAWLRRAWILSAHCVPTAAHDALRSPAAIAGEWLPTWQEAHDLFGMRTSTPPPSTSTSPPAHGTVADSGTGDPATWRAATAADATRRGALSRG